MKKAIFLIIAYVLFAALSLVADFLYDKSIKGVVDRSTHTTMVASELVADSNGAYQGRYIVFTSANANINGEVRLITNFYADYDSIDFDPALLVAPEVGDSFHIIPVYGVLFADIGDMADTTKKTILKSPYNPIAVDTRGRVTTLGDVVLAALDGYRIRYFPLNRYPKDSAHYIDPSAGADSIVARRYYYKTSSVISVEQHEVN